MPRWTSVLVVCCILWVELLGQSLAVAATRVDLVINEPFPDRTAVWPVTTGVPFPRGLLTGVEHCRLIDDRGQERPLQARVAATWDAERQSVRWLTIDFMAEPGRKYALEVGPDVVCKPSSTTLLITENKDTREVRVVTGALNVEFTSTGPSALKFVATDLNGNGQVEPDEAVAAGATNGEHYYIDQAGKRFSSAGDGADRQIVVETNGPVRGCVRVDGFYTGPGGARIAKYRTRFHFFAGLPLVKVIDELGFIGLTKGTRFADIGFALDLKSDTAGRSVVVDSSGEPGNQLLTVPWLADTQAVASFQKTFRHYGNLEHEAAVIQTNGQETKVLAQPERMGEWMQTSDGRCSVTGSLRWFWQQFPKEWEVKPKQMVLHLWSPRAGELDFGAAGIEKFFGAQGAKYLREPDKPGANPLDRFFFHAEADAIARGDADGLGINKHHEFFLHFVPASRRAEGYEYGRLAAQQPLALATGEWNCSTDVFGPLAARPNVSPYEAAVDKIFDLIRVVQDDFGDYGWWLFGAGSHYSYHWNPETKRYYADARRFEFHTYQKETQLWWNYLRSGERKFYDWAIPSENHWVDVAVSHMPTKIECGWRGGEPAPRTLHWQPGEWSVDSPTHYVRHHNTAEAWLRGGAQFWASYHRTLETTTLAYYLTGDERYNDVIQYWRTYFGELGGVTSVSQNVPPWYREQAWYKASAPGEPDGSGERKEPRQPVKNWAMMIRDYAPFHSGTRHEMTMFFNVSTLYEHTWDPKVKLALQDCADAFLEPAHPTGTWRPQDVDLPAHADSPSMGHFWVPALWKYARASNDPRMPDILKRYFATGYAADPFREHGVVGIYSNTYLGYAYYFTKDPRFIPLAVKELERLLPFSYPLEKPDDIGPRIYNPYAPAETFTAVPRLNWALDAAKKSGVRTGERPLSPQRTATAFSKQPGKELQATLWGYEPTLTIIGPDAKPSTVTTVKSETHRSEVQPFDRTLPVYEVYLHQVTIPASAPAGSYVVSPELELAALDWIDAPAPFWNAASPLLLNPGESVSLPVAATDTLLKLESAEAAAIRIRNAEGTEVMGKVTGNSVTFSLEGNRSAAVLIDFRAQPGWFKIVDRPVESCWVSPAGAFIQTAAAGPRGAQSGMIVPDRAVTLASLRTVALPATDKPFVQGKFGSAAQVIPGRALHLTDYLKSADGDLPLLNPREGTIEFWVRAEWDPRLNPAKPASLLTNGQYTVPLPPKLRLGEWTHVAFVWIPYRGDTDRMMNYTYIDGRDASFYRSMNWDGYNSARPANKQNMVTQLKEFLSRAVPGTAWSIDELRMSKNARYADPQVKYGPQQTFNPTRFTPPTAPHQPDADTVLLLHFDGDLKATVPEQLPVGRLAE